MQSWDRWSQHHQGALGSPPALQHAAPAREPRQLLSEMLGVLWKVKTNVCLQCMSQLLLLSSARAQESPGMQV